ncbi:MAG: ester cyclase [Thermoleophilaceae bacterium]
MAQKTGDQATDKAAAAASDAKAGRKRITRRKAVEDKVRSYLEAMDKRDAAGMAAHWREDGVEDVVPVGVMRGRDELREFFASMFAAMPDARTTVTRLVAGEQSCAVEWRIEGTFDGAQYMGIEPTGKHVEIRGFDLIEVEDGELVSNTAYFDGAAFARQIGMLPPDGSGADRAMKSAFNALTKVRRAVAERRNGG